MKNRTKITFNVVEGAAVAVSLFMAVVSTRKLMEEKDKTAKVKRDMEIWKTEVRKMEDFLEWDLDYMEDKANLNMVVLKASDLHRYGDKELVEAREYTKEYVARELLHNIRDRVSMTRKIVEGEKK